MRKVIASLHLIMEEIMHFPACLEDTESSGTFFEVVEKQALQMRSHKTGVGPRATSHLGFL